ncbi:hypothetical protein C8R43DRAFT_964095 [Mycena crocata]|nr:hypothetical protein C8R43DRAFT_964095 [Mycena crocata]
MFTLRNECALTDLNFHFKSPFLEPISNTVQSLLTIVHGIRKNKEDCTRLMEQVHTLLYAVITLHVRSETWVQLLPADLNNLGKFTETLHKIHSFLELQQETSKFKQFFCHGEMSALLEECNQGLEQALDDFKIQDVNVLKNITDMHKYAQERHQEVL